MDVDKFISDCALYVGECKEASFWGNTKSYVEEHCSASPIEKIFYTAVCTIIKTDCAFPEIAGQVSIGTMRDVWIEPGIEIYTQQEIGPYRVDFILSYSGECILRDAVHQQDAPEKPLKEIVVELDGHAFHDRDAAQRSYEKRRDRFLQKQGYKVFHYTGSDVVTDPFGVAIECLAYLTGKSEKWFERPELGE